MLIGMYKVFYVIMNEVSYYKFYWQYKKCWKNIMIFLKSKRNCTYRNLVILRLPENLM